MIPTVNLCFSVIPIIETKTKCARAVIYSVELYKWLKLIWVGLCLYFCVLLDDRTVHQVYVISLILLEVHLHSIGRPYRLTQLFSFYLHITGTVLGLHIHSEPVLSDSVISTPVIGYCVAGCLVVRFHVFSSKCSKLYVLHVRTCMCGIKLPQRMGDHLWHG